MNEGQAEFRRAVVDTVAQAAPGRLKACAAPGTGFTEGFRCDLPGQEELT
jgi:hypothetical protein